MNPLPALDWHAVTTQLLHAMQLGQQTLLQWLTALGLTHAVAGQPGWPWAWRLSGEVLLIDRSVLRTLLAALTATAASLLLAALALAWRRARWPLLVLAMALPACVPWPDWQLLIAPATPASFHTSPTAFAPVSIVRGEALYRQQCISCHGANGRGDTPLGLSLPSAPPNLAGPLLWRRADGDLLWHILHGRGAMPAFDAQLSVSDAWALVDYMKANAAGTSLRETGLWQQPIALPSLPLRCTGKTLTSTTQWRGQRVRLVWPAADGALPLDDPRLNSVVIGNVHAAAPTAGQPAIDCIDQDATSLRALAIITGQTSGAAQAVDAGKDQLEDRFKGMQLIADRDGWLRARKLDGDGASWSDADMLCRSPLASGAKAKQEEGKNQTGLDGLIAAMDAEPVNFVKGGFMH